MVNIKNNDYFSEDERRMKVQLDTDLSLLIIANLENHYQKIIRSPGW